MTISIVIIGYEKWEEYTLPLIENIRLHEPDVEIICVDNGSKISYPEGSDYWRTRIGENVCYSAAVNIGVRVATGDWLIVMNNDVEISKPFAEYVSTFPQNVLYGFNLIKHGGWPSFLSGWCLFIPREILDVVGLFDENFTPMWLEDADYSFRALAAGYHLHRLDADAWGFRHRADEHTRERLSRKRMNRSSYTHNLNYLRTKHGLP